MLSVGPLLSVGVLLGVGLTGAAARAEQGAVLLLPRLAADNSLTVELRNLSKLPVQLTGASLQFAASAGRAPCAVSLPGPVSIGPAETKTVPFATGREVGSCVPLPGGSERSRRMSVLTTPEFARPERVPMRSPGANLHPADLAYTLRIGDRAVSDTTTWHFAPE